MLYLMFGRVIAISYKDNDNCMDEAIKTLQFMGFLSWKLTEEHTERSVVQDGDGLRQTWCRENGEYIRLVSIYDPDQNMYRCALCRFVDGYAEDEKIEN